MKKQRPEMIKVHPDFKTMLKTKASLENDSMINCSKGLADDIERVLRGRGLLRDVDETNEERKKKNRIFF